MLYLIRRALSSFDYGHPMAIAHRHPDESKNRTQSYYPSGHRIRETMGSRHRILRFEKFFEINKGHPFVWECHDCHNGVVIPGTYKNIHGQIVAIDHKSLIPNTEVMRF